MNYALGLRVFRGLYEITLYILPCAGFSQACVNEIQFGAVHDSGFCVSG